MGRRLENFNNLKRHPMIKNLFKKLRTDELVQCQDFIKEHEGLDDNAYAYACNRWYLDKPKPKNYSTMWAIVFQSK